MPVEVAGVGVRLGSKHVNWYVVSSAQALASLGRLEGTDAPVVVFGHGDPWTDGVAAALAAARAAFRGP
jgi:glyoxylase-like metal-dependent hydrolase (beta-lactamase superfamily II)